MNETAFATFERAAPSRCTCASSREETARPAASSAGLTIFDPELRRARAALNRAKAVGEEYQGVEGATAVVRARRAGQAIVREAKARYPRSELLMERFRTLLYAPQGRSNLPLAVSGAVVRR